jgi:ketosteroid isomerase-like protein
VGAVSQAKSAQEHREALERFYDAFNARDLGRILTEMDPEIEFESRFARAGGSTYRGHDGVRSWFADLADAREYIEVHLGETFESDVDRTIAQITLRGKGRASGIELNERATHEIWWREGKLAHLGYVGQGEERLEV